MSEFFESNGNIVSLNFLTFFSSFFLSFESFKSDFNDNFTTKFELSFQLKFVCQKKTPVLHHRRNLLRYVARVKEEPFTVVNLRCVFSRR